MFIKAPQGRIQDFATAWGGGGFGNRGGARCSGGSKGGFRGWNPRLRFFLLVSTCI